MHIKLNGCLLASRAGCPVLPVLPCTAALYPIDTIKTRLQAMRSGGGIRALLQAGGGRSLYAGVWGNLAGVAPSSAIFMAVYEPVKQVGAPARACLWQPAYARRARQLAHLQCSCGQLWRAVARL
jgi:hypothetical protein